MVFMNFMFYHLDGEIAICQLAQFGNLYVVKLVYRFMALGGNRGGNSLVKSSWKHVLLSQDMTKPFSVYVNELPCK